jgi:outer membrane protein assembly factor BamB
MAMVLCPIRSEASFRGTPWASRWEQCPCRKSRKQMWGSPVVGGRDGLYAVGLQTGTQKWKFQTGVLTFSPAVADGVVYAGGNDGFLHAVDAQTGEERWKSAGQAGRMAILAGEVYFGSADTSLHPIDTQTGRQNAVK